MYFKTQIKKNYRRES